MSKKILPRTRLRYQQNVLLSPTEVTRKATHDTLSPDWCWVPLLRRTEPLTLHSALLRLGRGAVDWSPRGTSLCSSRIGISER